MHILDLGFLESVVAGEVTVQDDPDHLNSGATFTSLAGITYNP
jgi:hypothetical protein